MKRISLLFAFILILVLDNVQAQPIAQINTAVTSTIAAPVRTEHLGFINPIKSFDSFILKGSNPDGYLEFTVRQDELVTNAVLNLQFTPSPALIPTQSQIKIYLNDQLMSVLGITKEQLGHPNELQIPLDPRYITNFNRMKIEFVGHYMTICENPASSTLWMDIGQKSSLDLTVQTLNVNNELNAFPVPFFDEFDQKQLILPLVFAGQPSLAQAKAAGILASWFGTKSAWRGAQFPVLMNQNPEKNSVVFLTNKNKPDLLKDFAEVTAPTVAMVSHPLNPYIKLLVIAGRDDEDLLTAVKGVAQGNLLFRGQSITVDKYKTLAPRKPYDAPNWIHTDRPTLFSEIQMYKEQLQASDLTNPQVALTFYVPPDLYYYDYHGIVLDLKYRYTPPSPLGISLLNINLNKFFVNSTPLLAGKNDNNSSLNFLSSKVQMESSERLNIPVLDIGPDNTLSFDFQYSIFLGGTTATDRCENYSMNSNSVAIDGNSTIDFSGYKHYITMPNLKVFVRGGFPYSRMADLSETLILMNNLPTAEELTTLMDTLASISSQTGFPALSVEIVSDWSLAKNVDKDLLIIGALPKEIQDDSQLNLLIDKTRSWLKEPFSADVPPDFSPQIYHTKANTETAVTGYGSMAAIVGLQSPYFKQRSVIAMLANGSDGFALMNQVLLDNKQRAQVYGSVSVIRQSEVKSMYVGNLYNVGHLPWWIMLWLELKQHPILISLFALAAVFMLTVVVWRLLTRVTRKRLKWDE